MAGAVAATCGAASQAGATTINLSNDFLTVDKIGSTNGLTSSHGDLLGDGVPIIKFSAENIQGTGGRYLVAVNIKGSNGALLASAASSFRSSQHVLIGKSTNITTGSHAEATLSAMIPITFKDTNIDPGVLITGTLDATASAGNGNAEITLTSFTYNIPPPPPTPPPVMHNLPTVPDDGSTLALLAAGFSGLLVLRHRRAIAASA
jgi:hypothetical protein